MSRAATTSDVFNAVAEPRRREIIGLLAGGQPRSVGELVESLQLAQPAVSKHLGVLRAVGLVSVRSVGKSRLYTLNPAELKAVHDWVKPFERFWSNQLDRIKQRAERKAAEARGEELIPYSNSKESRHGHSDRKRRRAEHQH